MADYKIVRSYGSDTEFGNTDGWYAVKLGESTESTRTHPQPSGSTTIPEIAIFDTSHRIVGSYGPYREFMLNLQHCMHTFMKFGDFNVEYETFPRQINLNKSFLFLLWAEVISHHSLALIEKDCQRNYCLQ